MALWIDSAQDDPVDGTVRDVGSGRPQYVSGALYGKPVVRFNGAEALSSAQGTRQSALVYYVDGIKQILRQNNPNNTVTFRESGNVVAVGGGHSPGGTFYSGDFVTADLTVLLIYNRVLTPEEVATLTQYLRNEYLVHTAAVNPQPASGVLVSETYVTLTWDGGDGARAHRVYVSTDRDAVANAAEGALAAVVTQPPVLLGTAGQHHDKHGHADRVDQARAGPRPHRHHLHARRHFDHRYPPDARQPAWLSLAGRGRELAIRAQPLCRSTSGRLWPWSRCPRRSRSTSMA
ncbi:MAG: hypothetical protein MUC88_28245 [Planctomycetes bacterium]|nr:hypothetical protein [Planctomycetota bacterium]